MDEVTEEAFGSRAFREMMDLFVTPEVKRRQGCGLLTKPYPLDAFQIIWFPDERKPIVRIGRAEVRVRLGLKLKADLDKRVGDQVLSTDFERVERFELLEGEDPDCGHVTFICIDGHWLGGFDAIYNKGLARRQLDVGCEFLAAADTSLGRKQLHAFVDNLFSAAELFAKASLLLLGEHDLREKANHNGIKTRYHRQRRISNVNASHPAVLDKLSTLRADARYLQGQLSLDLEEATEMLGTVRGIERHARSICGN